MPITVVYGADQDEFDSLIGTDFETAVGAVRKIMNVPSEVTDIRLNGQQSPLNTRLLKDGDVISFYKKSGRKG